MASSRTTGAVATLLVAMLPGGCDPSTSCTPDDHDLGSARRLTIRRLPGQDPRAQACTRARLEVIASQEDLDRLNTEIGVRGDGDAGTAVDFARERVLVREGVGGEGILWAVETGETAVVGLQRCSSPTTPSCYVEVIAVPALVSRVESRACDAVPCGSPLIINTPGK